MLIEENHISSGAPFYRLVPMCDPLPPLIHTTRELNFSVPGLRESRLCHNIPSLRLAAYVHGNQAMWRGFRAPRADLRAYNQTATSSVTDHLKTPRM
jgi:hypothetical protein